MKKVKKEKDNSERWMLSYLDFITLLMIFFLVMYAISNVDKEKYANLASSLREGFNITSGKDPINVGFNNGEGSNDSVSVEATKLKNMENELNDLIKESNLTGNVSTSRDERGLVLSFTDSILFNSGQSDIKDELKPKLIFIAEILNQSDNYIRIEGHTDNVAIQNDKYHSNWQLSSIRAANVVEFLANDGKVSPDRLSAVGYSEYRAINDNSTDEKKAANRRVDILILDSKYNQTENGYKEPSKTTAANNKK